MQENHADWLVEFPEGIRFTCLHGFTAEVVLTREEASP